MKTKEELISIKKEVESLNKKLAELSEEELSQVTGGIQDVFVGQSAGRQVSDEMQGKIIGRGGRN